MDRNNQTVIRGRPVSSLDAAKANEFFELFINAGTLKSILGTYRSICELLHLKPNTLPFFYPKLKTYLTSWRAKALWKKFDQRANAKCYGRGKICSNTRVLIIGAGPCGLRTAIEAQLLGAKVVVVEKRDRMSRNNVLHLWRFVIEDLRALGAKKFFGKFCAGAIDHISIRQLQCILLKVALLLGVEIHTEVSFENLIEPNAEEKIAWRGQFKPAEHPVSQFEFDVIIGADGKRNTLQGFQRKEFRGKLAIAITANFINKRTEAEARVEEISGVAFIFNQKFFKDLYAETGIDLENIVYYKDDTHYFVMTAKKTSLINKGVIRQDLPDTAKLLAPDNVDRDALMNYAREAAEFSTHYQMPNLEFAVNHYGQPDVAMFDFTSMYQAENASKIIEKHGCKLLATLVGDSLLEPFWPTGSGCARGFLSSLDAAWAIRGWGSGQLTPLEVLAERESIYRLLAQTTPENLNKDYKAYTLEPSTRYPNLNKNVLLPHQMVSLYNTDDPKSIELQPRTTNISEVPKKKRKRDSYVDPDTLLSWIKKQVCEHEDIEINDVSSFKDGKILCAIIHHYRPDLIDYNSIKVDDAAKNNQLAFDILEKEIGIQPVMTGEEMANNDDLDFLALISYLTQIYDTFRREIPHIKHPKMELTDIKRNEPIPKTFFTHNISKIPIQHIHVQTNRPHSRQKRYAEAFNNIKSPISVLDRKTRKRRTSEKIGIGVEERQKRLEDIVNNRTERHNKRREQRKLQTEQFIKSMQMLQANTWQPTEPFEDYSIFLYRQTAPNFEDRVKDLEKKFTYVPDRENRRPSLTKGQTDEDFAARIKTIEDKYLDQAPTEKKPKDLLRAIGKIETTDWNIKEIEKKIQENKMGKTVSKEKEKVPKWNREQFSARLTKMEKQHLERQDSTGGKFNEIDTKIKQLDQKIKEGTTRDLNQHKVQSITEKLTSKIVEPESKPIQRSNSRSAVVLPSKTNSECCHFCQKRVYLVERLSTEGKFFHRGCFRCQYCHTALRLNAYMFDRDGRYGHRFYCQQHYGMPGELYPTKIDRKDSFKTSKQSPEKRNFTDGGDIAPSDAVQHSERPHFENLSTGNISSEHEESLSQMDEDEWTDRNFGPSTAEMGSSDEYSSSNSDIDSDDEDNYEEALEEPPTKEGTLRWAERIKRRYSKKNDSDSGDCSSSDHSGYYDNSTDDDDTDTATEGEEDILARELRKQEVCVQPPVVHTDTGTDSEVSSNESSTESSSDILNSATEISTDSEFALEETTPTREIPPILHKDHFVTKTRGNYRSPKKVQIKSSVLQKSNVRKPIVEEDIQLKFTPLVPPSVIRNPTSSSLFRNEGYALNRTQSTGGIAAKVSLELKKRYLLGESTVPGNIQKSGSVSTLDSKFKSFHSNITDCQKLLKPAPDVSASMKTFCSKLDERTSPLSPTFLSQSPTIFSNNLNKTNLITASQETVDKTITSVESNTDITSNKNKDFENETEGRPRSPVHETSIIVPQIQWNDRNKNDKKTDSLDDVTSSTESYLSDDQKKSKTTNLFANIPRLEVHDDAGIILNDEEIPFDSLNMETPQENLNYSIEAPKSISSEKKILNQPKTLPSLQSDAILAEVHEILHTKPSDDKINYEYKEQKNSSGRSTPSAADQATAALTETELSDWARDEAVSDDYEDVEFNKPSQSKDLEKLRNECINVAKIQELEELSHMSPKKYLNENKNIELTECVNSILNPSNLDNIEFMDNGTETSSDDDNGNNGYMQLQNEDDDGLMDSLNPIVEATNPILFNNDKDLNTQLIKSTDLNIINNDRSSYGEITDLKPIDVQKLVEKHKALENEEDSLFIVEAGTTTEENTCSDSTVKNVTEKLTKLNQDIALLKLNTENNHNSTITNEKPENAQNIEYDEHCQRLASKVEFGNAKDSIDIRKSKRKGKNDQQSKPDLIQEEKEQTAIINNPLAVNKLYKREEIEKERDKNQKLIQEMVMNKMKAQNKSLERKKRNKGSFSPIRPFELAKSATTDLSIELKNNYNDPNNKKQIIKPPPDIITTIPIQKSQTVSDFKVNEPSKTITLTSRPLSVHIPKLNIDNVLKTANNSETLSLPNINESFNKEEHFTPKAPPRHKHDDFKRNLEHISKDFRKNFPDEQLNLGYINKFDKLKQQKSKRSKENIYVEDSIESLVLNTERRNSVLYSNDTLSKKRNNSFKRCKSGGDAYNTTDDRMSMKLNKPDRKSVPDFDHLKTDYSKITSIQSVQSLHKSDPNLLNGVNDNKKEKRKIKDSERRKSITKFISDIFTKKKDNSPNTTNKGFFSIITPKTKEKSKEVANKQIIRRSSLTQLNQNRETPPPIPPLPLGYTGPKLLKDDSSEYESDCKALEKQDMENHRVVDESTSNLNSRRNSRNGRKSSRQAQLKRHRMAQEIQRKLEEIEVKTRELERQGVLVEKALRGESSNSENNLDETELLKEWFDLMRDRTELRRYEKELLIRAQELELEDRHARLQHQLRERLETDDTKTEDDVKYEGSIIKEMMDIVAKRDSLITLLEEDRLRYSEEDKDFEEQMLAKGLKLTPLAQEK